MVSRKPVADSGVCGGGESVYGSGQDGRYLHEARDHTRLQRRLVVETEERGARKAW